MRTLDAAWELGIRAFDTALTYGSASARLARWLARHCSSATEPVQVVTKVSWHRGLLADAIDEATTPFRGYADLVVLSHGSLTGRRWREFRDLCTTQGLTCGQSVYTAVEAAAAAGETGCHLIQAPANVLDRRNVAVSATTTVPFDFRSVYLQGLLLESATNADTRVPGSAPIVHIVANAARRYGADVAGLLLGVMLHLVPAKDRIVIGVDSAEQLNAIRFAQSVDRAMADAVAREVDSLVERLSFPEQLLDPRTWVTNGR